MIKISWDDTKVANDDFLSAEWNSMVTDQKARIKITTGITAPVAAPDAIGYVYIDTTNLKMYIAMGTSAASDWKKVITQ